jgi:hypothetical protein
MLRLIAQLIILLAQKSWLSGTEALLDDLMNSITECEIMFCSFCNPQKKVAISKEFELKLLL